MTRVLVIGAVLLLLGVTTSSAYIRLATSGIGCEPWPVCHAEWLTVGSAQGRIVAAHEDAHGAAARGAAWVDASEPVTIARGVHRLSASLAGVWLLVLLFVGWNDLATVGARVAMVALVVLAGLLALLGVATHSGLKLVTLGNLLGGMAMIGCAGWLVGASARAGLRSTRHRKVLATTLLVALFAQIALGGLLGVHGAASHCASLPLCAPLLPSDAAAWVVFDPFGGMFGVIDSPFADDARTIAATSLLHNAHRLLALVVIALVAWLAIDASASWRGRAGLERDAMRESAGLRPLLLPGLVLAVAVMTAIAGIWLVAQRYPLTGAVLHNLLAALLLLAVAALLAHPITSAAPR